MAKMAKLSNSQKQDLHFFLSSDDKVKYCSKCANCANDCKQSYRVKIWHCLDYVDRHKVTKNKPTSTEKN